MQPDRRKILKSALALTAASQFGLAQPAKAVFRHRGYLGWIVDIDARPEPAASWPSIRLDENLVEQYRDTFLLMRQLGYNEAVMCGMYVGRSWPLDIRSCVTPARARLIQQLIDAAHRENLKVILTTGVFSWGFELLIKTYPELGPTNPKAMCASNPEAWRWMERIMDFNVTRFPTDGVSMQSADQGRCTCEKCARWNNDEYHVMINTRMAGYIRARYPKQLIAVSGWGINFNNEKSTPLFVEMSKRLDYLIDVVDSAGLNGDAYRRKLISSLHCDFGTIGGPLVEPPLHWNRERWFLPTVQAQGSHLKLIHDSGGRACEYFNHIRANPGDEVTFYITGKVLSDPLESWQTHLRTTLEELYQTRGTTTGRLAELFIQAETAYTGRMLNRRTSGDISLEPLDEDYAGPPIYLSKNLSASGRAGYAADLVKIQAAFRQIAFDIPEKPRIAKILRCLENVQKDLQSIPS